MKSNKKWSMLTLIMMFWFTISFITNILGPLIPDIIHNFELKDLAMAGFIPTSFFLAYAIMSIPAGILIDKYGEKPVLFTGFLMPFIGTTLFACFPFYLILLLSSFIIGLGMAMLQTVINPLQRVVGGEENYAFYSRVGTVCIRSSLFYQSLGLHLADTCTGTGSLSAGTELFCWIFWQKLLRLLFPGFLCIGYLQHCCWLCCSLCHSFIFRALN